MAKATNAGTGLTAGERAAFERIRDPEMLRFLVKMAEELLKQQRLERSRKQRRAR